jgi:omega-6 fatty acid desaturase (delta-12 desaturase)
VQKYIAPAAAGSMDLPSAASLKARVRDFAKRCAEFRGADEKRALIQILTTAVPFVLIVGLMLGTLEYAYWPTLMLAFPAGGLVVRFFIIQHDCGHGSFFRSRWANDTMGRAMSLFTVAPYGLWRRVHAKHHAGSGNLDRRGFGDIKTLTVSEYLALPRTARFRYRIYRHPAFLFLIGVPLFFMVLQRLPWGHGLSARDAWRSVVGLDIALVVVYGAVASVIGLKPLLMIGLPICLIASAVGGWLFYIQHQFEDAHWRPDEEWDFQTAAVYGSTYYALPPVLNWFTGNIGLHHIHHLNSMIPNYRLQDCLVACPELEDVNRLTIRESLACVRFALWDESSGKLVGFRDVAAARNC